MARPANWLHDRECFYKYMSADTAKIVLKNRTLRWSSPTLFNDPFDVQFDLHIEYDRNEVRQKVLEEIWAAYRGERELGAENPFGLLLSLLREGAPNLSKEEVLEGFPEAIDEALPAQKPIFLNFMRT